MLQPETWRPIPGFPGYEASDYGRIRSKRVSQIPRLLRPGLHRNTGIGKQGTKHERLNVALRRDGKTHTKHVHSLVLLTFVGPRPEGLEARHLNGQHHDNRLANLRWGTKSENALDTVAHGNHPKQQGAI